MPRYIGYNFTGTANTSVTKFSGAVANLPSNVVAYVNYDGNTRTVQYSTGASAATYNGTAGSLTTSQTKDGTHSLDPANGEYLTLASALGTTGTIEAYFYSSSLPGLNERLFGIGSHQETNQFQCFMNGGTSNITLRQGSSTIMNASSSFTTSQWNHIAYSWSGGTGQFYVNGTRIGNFSQSGSYSDTVVSIGNIEGLSSYVWGGFIDCVRISTVARYSGTSITVPDPSDLLYAQSISTVDKKYNSGIWSISDSSGEEYSLFTRRKQGNWLTSSRGAAVWDNFTVLAVNLTTDASDASGYSPAHTITVSGDTSFGASGANFDGSGDKIRYVGNGGDPFNIAGNEDFVIQFELDVDETGPAGPFDTGINVGGIGAFTNGGSSTATKYFRIIGGADISVATTWNGTWRIERSGSTITLYKDDVSQGTATYSGAISSAASGSAITLGSHDLNSTYPTYYELDGRIRYFQFRKGTTTVLTPPF